MRIIDGAGRHIDDAARIWAEATAARDGESEVAPLIVARPMIDRVLAASPRSMLLVALTEEDRAVGFAAVEPLRYKDNVAEVRYLGVRPDAWGQGVGGALLRALPGRLAAAGFDRAELWVYEDNARAVRLYERLGWRADGDARPHPRTGRPERRYHLDCLQ